MTNVNETAGRNLNVIARALVPFFVQYFAAFLACEFPHTNAIRGSGSATAHRATHYPAFNRARNALIHAFDANYAEREDKEAALNAARGILAAETSARHAGLSWDIDTAIAAWREGSV